MCACTCTFMCSANVRQRLESCLNYTRNRCAFFKTYAYMIPFSLNEISSTLKQVLKLVSCFFIPVSHKHIMLLKRFRMCECEGRLVCPKKNATASITWQRMTKCDMTDSNRKSFACCRRVRHHSCLSVGERESETVLMAQEMVQSAAAEKL